MQETKNQKKIAGSYIVNKKILSGWVQAFLSGLKGLLNFFSLRKSRNFWGIVYDSVSKQPLDPVIVKLLYTDGREVETCVTDLGGRYGFLAKPGKFKIHVRKTNYSFPSKYAPGDSDGIYQNLYHGEFFTLFDNSEVLAPNIPMDPEKFDWNQQAKNRLTKTRPFLKLFFKKLIAVIFWFGLAACLLTLWRFYPVIPPYLYLIATVYAVLIILSRANGEPRLWGRVAIKNSGLNPERIFLELHSARFPAVSFGKALAHQDGRFLLRAGKGSYILSVNRIADTKEKVFLGSVPVSIGSSGVFNRTVEIKEQ